MPPLVAMRLAGGGARAMIQPASSAFDRGQTVVPGNNQTMPDDFMTRLRVRCRDRGFTLVELMITLAVAAILAIIAVPTFKHVLASTHLSGVNNELAGDLQYARTEAVSRQVGVAVAASSGGWQDGWTVEIPSASTAAGATPTILRRHSAVPAQYLVVSAATDVKYQPQGSLANPAGANSTCFTIYTRKGQHNKTLYLQVLLAGGLQQTQSAKESPDSSDTPTDCTKPTS